MARIITIVSFEDKISNLFEIVDELPSDELILSHWSRYICILCYGYIETSVRTLFLEYTKKRSQQSIANYVEKKLDQFRNATFNNIKVLACSFNSEWSDLFESDIDQEIKDAITSLANNRHQIAHGKSTGISFVYVKEWHKKSKRFISFLENLFQLT